MADAVRPEVPPVNSIIPGEAGVEVTPNAPKPATVSAGTDATLANELAQAEEPVNAAKKFDELMQKAGANGASVAQGASLNFAQIEIQVNNTLSAIPPTQ